MDGIIFSGATRMNEILDYEQKKKIYIEYLLLKVQEEDWHGVSDAANDLRVLEAKNEN